MNTKFRGNGRPMTGGAMVIDLGGDPNSGLLWFVPLCGDPTDPEGEFLKTWWPEPFGSTFEPDGAYVDRVVGVFHSTGLTDVHVAEYGDRLTRYGF